MAGYPAAITMATMGAEVTLIERAEIGGVCLNRGCMPTKSLLYSCELYHTLKNAKNFGIECQGLELNFKGVWKRKNETVNKLREGVEKLLNAKKINLVRGTATLIDNSSVRVEETDQIIQSDAVIIATGSVPRGLDIPGAAESDIMSSDDFLALEKPLKSAVIIGGGYVGVEFAQILNGLGSKVVLLEALNRLLPGADREIANALKQFLVKQGIQIFTGVQVMEIQQSGDGKIVFFDAAGKNKQCLAEAVLICVGRKPYFKGLGVESLGLHLENGFLAVNERMETNIPGIYAAGDVTGGVMLAHVATAQAECAVRNALGQPTQMDYRVVPSCIYTSPEVASVGMTQEEAKEKYDVKVGRFPLQSSGKAQIINQGQGRVKIIADREHGEILGVHIIGPKATELIAEAVLGMSMGMTTHDLAEAIHPHPTLSEALREAALSLTGGAIHAL